MFNSLDHIAFRVNRKNHDAVVDMFTNLFGYELADKFEPEFPTGGTQGTKCTVLSPKGVKSDTPRVKEIDGVMYQTTPDIFISSSDQEDSVVSKWVANRNGIGGVHHFAFETDSVEDTMNKFHDSGFEFLTKNPIVCDELTQTFTKPSDLVNVIFEFLERKLASFCKSSVGSLMSATKNCE